MSWDKILISAVKEAMVNRDFALSFERAVDYSSWPSCTAKELATTFFSRAKEKNILQAQIEMRETSAAIVGVSLETDLEKCLTQISMAASTGTGLELAKKFQADPANYRSTFLKTQSVSEVARSVDLRLVSEDVFKRAAMALQATKTRNRCVGGYPLLSKLIGGFNDSRITMCVAGTGVGKTTFMLNLALEAIKDFPILFINMEMSIDDILHRIAAISAGVSQSHLDYLTKEGLDARAKAHSYLLSHNPIFMTDGSSMSAQQIANEIYSRSKEGVKFVIIDYDQKIKTDDSYDQEWKVILKTVEALEEIAKQTKVHVIILAQGDDDNEPKASKRSKQPCAAVLSFFQDGEKFFIKSLKNRFGPKFKLEMKCDFNRYSIKEHQQIFHEDPIQRFSR